MAEISIPYRQYQILEENELSIEIEETFRNVFESNNVLCVLHFEKPINRLAFCSISQILLFNSLTRKVEIVMKKHENNVYDIKRWSKGTFLSCSEDHFVRSHNVKTGENIKSFNLKNPVVRLLKLTEELFLARTTNELIITNYETETRYRSFKLANLLGGYLYPLIKSIVHHDCFYIPIQDNKNSIKLIDYKTQTIFKKFNRHSKVRNRKLFALTIFKNTKNEEILVAAESKGYFFSYNTSSDEFTKNKKIPVTPVAKYFESHYEEFKILSIQTYYTSGKYFYCGGREGVFEVFEIMENSVKKIGSIDFSKWGGIYKIEFFSRSIEIDNSVKLVVCSSDGIASIVRVNGLKNSENQDDLDEKERIHFLIDRVNNYVFSQGLRKEIFLFIKFFLDDNKLICFRSML